MWEDNEAISGEAVILRKQRKIEIGSRDNSSEDIWAANMTRLNMISYTSE